MNRKEYEEYVNSRCQTYVTEPYCVIAINEEAGEIAGWYKKYVLRGNVTGDLRLDDLKSELGDLLFYLTQMAKLYGWTINDVMEFNKEKLDDRVTKGMKQVV